jgi:hypothetical protein
MNFFAAKCDVEHLRKSARECIKENEASERGEEPGGNEQVREQRRAGWQKG